MWFASLGLHRFDEFFDERSSGMLGEHGSEHVLGDVAGAQSR